MGAPLAYFQITGPEPTALADFYAALFDWSLSEGPEPGYAMVDTGAGEVGGGIGATQGADDPPGVTIYLRVDELQRSLDQAEALGGATVLGPTELPGGYGSFALLADPASNTVGIWA